MDQKQELLVHSMFLKEDKGLSSQHGGIGIFLSFFHFGNTPDMYAVTVHVLETAFKSQVYKHLFQQAWAEIQVQPLQTLYGLSS